MRPVAELIQSRAGLVCRLRRGQPRDGLIVMLHGLSGDENAMWIFDHALPRAATVAAPRALYASELGGYSWTPAVARDELAEVDFQAAIDRLQHFVEEAIASYEVDPQRVIMLGFSQGAALSYAFSLAHPELLQGVIALAGFLPGPTRRAPSARMEHEGSHAVAHSPHYLIIHGLRDEAVPIDRAREARAVLAGRGAAVEYHEHRVGHKVTAQGMQEIKQWIAAILGTVHS